MSDSVFSVAVYQNLYLLAGERKVSAVVSVTTPEELAADFTAMTRPAMSGRVADVVLRLWTPASATVRFVRQVAPSIEDLTARRGQAGPQAGDYPAAAWAPGEIRDYHVGVQVDPADVGREMLAVRVSLVASSPARQQVLGEGLVRAIWTDDEALAIRIDARVAHYTGQAELAAAIQDGLEASKLGDEDTATARLGRAVVLARQAGNVDTARLLAKVVDVVDEETGIVRLKKTTVDFGCFGCFGLRSVKTVRVGKMHDAVPSGKSVPPVP